jgi:hypothetical protein
MQPKTASLLAGASGLIGTLMLVASFSLNVGPPPGATDDQLIAFSHANFTSILLGAWLQAVGPVFIVILAFRIVTLAGATTRVDGWMTLFGVSALMTVSLVEIVFYMSALHDRPPMTVTVSYQLIQSVQHLYFIVAAPAVFIPLGLIIRGSHVLPQWLGWLALALGLAFAVAGMATLLSLEVPPAIQASASIQALWWLAAAIALMLRAYRPVGSHGVRGSTHQASSEGSDAW